MNQAAISILNEYCNKYEFINTIKDQLSDAIDIIIECYDNKGKILVCGNGGSNSDADHIVGELVKGFLKKRPVGEKLAKAFEFYGDQGKKLSQYTQLSLPVINLGAHTSLITAIINDLGGEYIFSQQVMGFGNEHDILIGISTSGNSQNVINAGIVAKIKGMKLIALSGVNGGKMKNEFDICLCAQSSVTPDIQDMHTSIYHALCACVEAHYFKE